MNHEIDAMTAKLVKLDFFFDRLLVSYCASSIMQNARSSVQWCPTLYT